MKKLYIIFFLALLVTCSCRKLRDREIFIKGRVVNAGNGQPINSAVVTVQDGVGNSNGLNFGPTSSGSKKSVVTNSNGDSPWK